ncbi:hypothetical protein Tco_0722239 [Tanacetum coccineum]
MTTPSNNSQMHNAIMEGGDKDIHAIQDKETKEKESCMISFRLLHSHLKVLSNKDLNKTRTEDGFKRAFVTLSEGKVDTSKTLDASLVITVSSGKEFETQDTNNKLGNDADVDDANIKPVYDEEPMG